MKMSRGCMHRWFHVLQLLKFLVIVKRGSLFTIFWVNRVWHQLNFNGLDLLFKITFWYWNVLLSLVATDGRDGHIYLLSQLFFNMPPIKTNKQKKWHLVCITFKARLSAKPLTWKWFLIIMQIKLIFTTKVSHFASFCKWDFWKSEMAYWNLWKYSFK